VTAPGGVLALDLATRSGWAYGDHEQQPDHGTWLLPNEGPYGRRYVALENEMEDAIALHRPRFIAIEAALVIADRASELLLGLAAHAQSTAYRASVDCKLVRVDDAREAVLGRGRFPSGTAKLHVMNWCRAEGYDPGDDNAGDALVLLRYTLMRLVPRRRRVAA
jgi:Holliday junction resolvasome RuvABC endonuclease subunit